MSHKSVSPLIGFVLAITTLLVPSMAFTEDSHQGSALAAGTPGYSAMYCDASRRIAVRETIGAGVFGGVILGVALGAWQSKSSSDSSAMPVVSGALGGLLGTLIGAIWADTSTPSCDYGYNAVMVPWDGGELVAMGVSRKF